MTMVILKEKQSLFAVIGVSLKERKCSCSKTGRKKGVKGASSAKIGGKKGEGERQSARKQERLCHSERWKRSRFQKKMKGPEVGHSIINQGFGEKRRGGHVRTR